MNNESTSNKHGTDWQRLEGMRDEDIDLSDVPEITPEAFARAAARRGMKSAAKKEQVTLRLDADVLSWFKAQGRGYQTRINELLRAFVDAHRGR